MHRADLTDYLDGNISSAELQEKIWRELAEFEKMLIKKGSSVPIYYDGDNQSIIFTSNHLNRLCNDYLEGKVNHIFLSYCTDALQLSEHTTYESDLIKNLLARLTDFEII